MFASFSVHMRRLLKGIWAKYEQHWDNENEVEPGEEDEFLRLKEQLQVVAETSVDRRPNFMYLLTHLKTRCVQWPIYVHNQKNV